MNFNSILTNLIHFRKWKVKGGKRKTFFLVPYTSSILLASTLLSCNMINEDLKPCAPAPHVYTVVDFEYTYNMKNEDWFSTHAGSVYLYVFDDNDTYLFRKSKTKLSMEPNNVDFSMVLDETELEPGNKYKLVAIAIGNHAGYTASLETPGFQVPEEYAMEPGVSKLQNYRLKLDRDGDGIYDFGVVTDDYGVFNFKDAYKENRLKLDTLWSTKPNSVQLLDLPYISFTPQVDTIPDVYVNVTIPMMRITNSIKLNLLNSTFDANTDPNGYNVIIDFPNGNGTIGFTGSTENSTQELMYMSIRKSMKQYQPKSNHAQYESDSNYDSNTDSDSGDDAENDNEEAGVETKTRADNGPTYALNAEFGISRMQILDGSFLEITNAETGNVICRLDEFSTWLADYFSDEHNFGDQEYLDREYDFTIDIKLNDTGDGIEWYQIGCSILGWGRRVQLLDFGR